MKVYLGCIGICLLSWVAGTRPGVDQAITTAISHLVSLFPFVVVIIMILAGLASMESPPPAQEFPGPFVLDLAALDFGEGPFLFHLPTPAE